MPQKKIFQKILQILVFLTLLWCLTGCNEEDQEKMIGTAPKYIKNPYAEKSVLILSQISDYKAKLIETAVNKLRYSYSITIDDLAKINEYNFALYNKVVLIESCMFGNFANVQNYLAGYTGINNIIIFGTAGDTSQARIDEYKKKFGVDAVTAASSLENVNTDADRLAQRVRAK